MLAINQPNDTTTLAAFGGNAEALQVAELLRGVENATLDQDVVSALGMWHLLPVFSAGGVGMEDIDWLDLSGGSRIHKSHSLACHPFCYRR